MAQNNKKQYSTTTKNNGRPDNHGNVKNDSMSFENQSFCTRFLYSNILMGLQSLDSFKPESLRNLVKDPMTYNDLLRELSLVLYGTNGVYTHTVDYLRAMPTLDRVVVTHGSNKRKKKRNSQLMESTLRTIKDREIMRDALFRDMVEGACYYYFETVKRPDSLVKMMHDSEVDSIVEINDVGLNCSIVSLPADYTRIVGIKNSSYVIAFNLDYFADGSSGESVDKKLRKFPKEIRDAYKQRKNSNNKNGNWVVLDNTKTIVHKIRSKREEQYGRPLVLAAISDIVYGDYFTQTKRNVLDNINNKVIYETFPEGREKGTSALTQNQQKAQHETVKNAILNKNSRGSMSVISLAAGTKLEALDIGDKDIFDEKNESNLSDRIALDMGIAGALLNGVGSGSYAAQQQNLELITAQLFEWIDGISAELNKCISANIIKDNQNWVEFKYLPITHVNKKEMVTNAKELYLQGKGSLSLWASACGIAPDVFFSLLDQELEENIENKYPVHQTSYTLSNKKGGRPTSDNPTDNTIRSQANNGNELPSPSDN